VKPFCLIFSIALLLAGGLTAQETTVDKPAGLVDRASYGIGINMARQWVAQEVPINLEFVIKGMRDGMAGSTALLSDEEINATFREMRQKLTEELAERNRQEGTAFLEANRARDGVVTLPSGLQYEVLTEGDGPMPKASDSVTVHYRGTLIDGTVFDSSYDRGEPASFGVGGVIQAAADEGGLQMEALRPVGARLWPESAWTGDSPERDPAVRSGAALGRGIRVADGSL
jgi:FKBP-type peptidyl-prolyl cis-trans isomerase